MIKPHGPHDHPTRLSQWALQWIAFGAGVALFGGLGISNLYTRYTQIEAIERDRLLVQSRIVGSTLEQHMLTINHALERVRTHLVEWQASTSRQDGYRPIAHQRLKELVTLLPGVRTLQVLDEQGTAQISNRPELVQRNFAERDYFQQMRHNHDAHILGLSAPFRSALGAYVMNITRRLQQEDGTFAGVVTASLDPSFLGDVIHSVLYAPDMWITIAHGGGRIFLSAPAGVDHADHTDASADLYAMDPLFRAHVESGQARSLLTDDDRILVIQTIPHANGSGLPRTTDPLVVMVGRQRVSLHREWHTDAWQHLTLFLVFTLCAGTGLAVVQARARLIDRKARKSHQALVASEQSLRRITQQYDKLVARIPVGICQFGLHRDDTAAGGTDLQGTPFAHISFHYVSPRCCEMMDLPEETMRRSWHPALARVHPDDRADLVHRIQEAGRMLPPHFIWEGRFVVRGELRWIRIAATPTPLPDGDSLWDSVQIDITEQKQMEEALRLARVEAERASRAKSEFLAVMSHEIRTPMNVIIGMSDVLLDADLGHEQRHYARKIQTAGHNLLELINQILDLSKIEAQQIHLLPEPTHLPTLLREAVEMLVPIAAGKGLVLACHLDDSTPEWVQIDRLRLRQVLLNILGNAVKFTEQGSINITSEMEQQPARRLHLRVQDTGIGIHAEHLEHIFESFTQADASISRRFGGTGLGLSLSRQLMTLMGGTLWVESQPGQGSTFHIALPGERIPSCTPPAAGATTTTAAPLAPASAALPVDPVLPVPAASSPQSGSPHSGRVLVVEDMEDNQLLIRAFLKQHPYRLEFATNGQEAVDAICTMDPDSPFDLVLMDVQMPVMDGHRATRMVRAWEQATGRPRLPIIALTAHALAGEADKSYEAGCDLYLTKPIRKQALLDVLARWIDPAGMDRTPTG
jgi:signal transduction histidine kinase/CheY-like chemotaxis protein